MHAAAGSMRSASKLAYLVEQGTGSLDLMSLVQVHVHVGARIASVARIIMLFFMYYLLSVSMLATYIYCVCVSLWVGGRARARARAHINQVAIFASV